MLWQQGHSRNRQPQFTSEGYSLDAVNSLSLALVVYVAVYPVWMLSPPNPARLIVYLFLALVIYVSRLLKVGI